CSPRNVFESVTRFHSLGRGPRARFQTEGVRIHSKKHSRNFSHAWGYYGSRVCR
ncbi:hypothetical protein M404DRAFT_994341, partial [Pisolithus tinctorius Marx 270]